MANAKMERCVCSMYAHSSGRRPSFLVFENSTFERFATLYYVQLNTTVSPVLPTRGTPAGDDARVLYTFSIARACPVQARQRRPHVATRMCACVRLDYLLQCGLASRWRQDHAQCGVRAARDTTGVPYGHIAAGGVARRVQLPDLPPLACDRSSDPSRCKADLPRRETCIDHMDASRRAPQL